MIEIKNITKTYQTGTQQLTVLKGLHFSITKGEFVAIVGKSGSGKSTLLYQMSLLDVPTSGTVIIDKKDTSQFSEEERVDYRLRELGYVFQEYALIPSLSAIENVSVPLLMRGSTFKNAYRQATEVLIKVGLEGKFDNLPSQLSGGQQQRVSIARAVAHKPQILYADEPTANLDTQTSDQVLKIFKELHGLGQTIVMVTHEAEYARLADRIITLADGNIISDEKPRHRTK